MAFLPTEIENEKLWLPFCTWSTLTKELSNVIHEKFVAKFGYIFKKVHTAHFLNNIFNGNCPSFFLRTLLWNIWLILKWAFSFLNHIQQKLVIVISEDPSEIIQTFLDFQVDALIF